MPEKHLSQGHHKRRRRRESRGISRLLKDIDTFKEPPKGMRRIGQAAMRERVSLKKVTKLIVDGGRRDGPDWEKRRPRSESQHSQPHPTQRLVAGQRGKSAHKSLPQIAPAGRGSFRKNAENSDQYCAINELTEVHVTKT